jgi:hypothetical protein
VSVLIEETGGERRAIGAMRSELRRRLSTGELEVSAVAERLGLVPDGVETLVRRPWTFEEAYRVAAALDFDFVGALQSG